MMTIKNRVQLIGNLGAAPEVKNLDNGNKMARFTVATSDNYTNKKGELVKGWKISLPKINPYERIRELEKQVQDLQAQLHEKEAEKLNKEMAKDVEDVSAMPF